MDALSVVTFQHKALVIKVKKSLPHNSVYDSVRYAWKVDPRRAGQAEIVLAVSKGEIIGVFVPYRWLPASEANFPGRWKPNDGSHGRFGFVGEEAPRAVVNEYLGKRLPARFTARGAVTPVWYVY